MKYLVIDAVLNSTGIRDKYEGGHTEPSNLGLSLKIKKKLNEWLSKYENEFFNGFNDKDIINKLDQEGKEIALLIKNELLEVKIQYFSNAYMKEEII